MPYIISFVSPYCVSCITDAHACCKNMYPYTHAQVHMCMHSSSNCGVSNVTLKYFGCVYL